MIAGIVGGAFGVFVILCCAICLLLCCTCYVRKSKSVQSVPPEQGTTEELGEVRSDYKGELSEPKGKTLHDYDDHSIPNPTYMKS